MVLKNCLPDMIKHIYKGMIVELIDDRTFSPGSTDCIEYAKQYFADGLEASNPSYCGISVCETDLLITNCLLIGSAGTTITDTSSLIDVNALLVCCGDSLFSLDLPSLQLNWQTNLDPAACFQVHMLNNGYLVHGELEISRVDRDGKVIWTFSGADIFVRYNGGDALIIGEDKIKLIDWEENEYLLDFNGKVVWDSFR